MKYLVKKTVFLVLVGLSLFTSCKTPRDIAYLQDALENVPIQTQTDGNIRFQPGDKLSIFVHSRDQQLMDLFNLVSGNTLSNSNTSGRGAYTIDPKGEIDFPVLGAIKVQGFTRNEVAQTIKTMLMERSLCNDPVVTVEFYNMSFSILGDFSDNETVLVGVTGNENLQGILPVTSDADTGIPHIVHKLITHIGEFLHFLKKYFSTFLFKP